MMTDPFDESACLLALDTALERKPRISGAILSHLGSASALFDLEPAQVKSLFPKGSDIPEKINEEAVGKARIQIRDAREEGLEYIPRESEFYPHLLRLCPDAPCGLFTRNPKASENFGCHIHIAPALKVREADIRFCKQLVECMLDRGTRPLVYLFHDQMEDLILIDEIASSGAEIAVIPRGGMSSFLKDLRMNSQALEKHIGILSDTPPGRITTSFTRLRCARIAAGSCHATIVTSASSSSRGITSAELAWSYNRETYALPGRIDDIRYRGNNTLIATARAELVLSAGWLASALSKTKK